MLSAFIHDKKKVQKIDEVSKRHLQPFKEEIKDNPCKYVKIML